MEGYLRTTGRIEEQHRGARASDAGTAEDGEEAADAVSPACQRKGLQDPRSADLCMST